DEFFAAAARFFQPVSKWRRPIVFLQFVLPHLARIFGLNGIDKTPVKFFTKVVSDTIKYRLKNGVRRSDFLQLLLDAILTELVITAQCVLFYIAGYDTTATTLSFVSYCLALHPKIQQKLLEEIDQVLQDCDSNITFEVIQNMTYLDMVFAETLRLYPPAPRVDRRCTKDYVLPEVGLSIHKNTKITIPIYSIHRDPRHYEDPEKFDPERFSQSAKAGRPPMVYLPFGSGPRNCIGWRFALMEAKVALVHILKDFVFIPSKKTQVPIVLERSSGLLKAIDGVWVRIVTRTDS
ncbi:cytochrome P450 9e2, partial [Armadillidium vulgare]